MHLLGQPCKENKLCECKSRHREDSKVEIILTSKMRDVTEMDMKVLTFPKGSYFSDPSL